MKTILELFKELKTKEQTKMLTDHDSFHEETAEIALKLLPLVEQETPQLIRAWNSAAMDSAGEGNFNTIQAYFLMIFKVGYQLRDMELKQELNKVYENS